MNCNRSTAREVFINRANRRTLGHLYPPYSDFVRRGARPRGTVWGIPEDAEKPADARIKNGNYIKKPAENEK